MWGYASGKDMVVCLVCSDSKKRLGEITQCVCSFIGVVEELG
jgi:hypothetical protein